MIFGVTFFGLTNYHLYYSLYDFGRINLTTSLWLSLMLVFLLSLFLACFVTLAVVIARGGIPLWVSLPFAWVSCDFFRNYFVFGGYPGSGLAYTQRSFLILLQVLDITGIYGITFLLVLTNGLIGEGWNWMRKASKAPLIPGALVFIILGTSLSYGLLRMKQVSHEMKGFPKIKIGLIQPDVPIRKKWTTELIYDVWDQGLEISRGLKDFHPNLLVWPETPNIAAIRSGRGFEPKLSSLNIPLLLNVMTYEGELPSHWPPTESDRNKGFLLFNSALLIEPGGKIVGEYRKNHLVPFGEYIPLAGWFKNLKSVVAGTNFSSGSNLAPLPLIDRERDLPLDLGVTICFEDMFPEIFRKLTRRGADLLVNLTNDGWFGRSAVLYQHFDFSRYRAIENRRSLARATNTGMTGFFSPTGEVLAGAPPFQQAALIGEVPVGGPITFYTRWGDVFAILSALAFGLLFLKSLWWRARVKG